MRSLITLENAVVILLLAMMAIPAFATDIVLKPYQASYAVYRGGLNVANSELSLEQSGRYWRWRQSSKAKGVYALFSNKTLYSETTILRYNDRYKIHNVLFTEEGDDDGYENARFSWDSHTVDIQYKKKRYIETLPEDIYDSHSIHLLSASMLIDNLQALEFTLYRKGKLQKSYLKQSAKSKLEINQKVFDVLVFEQTTAGSSAIMKYYYKPQEPLLPIKIERIKPNKKTTIMLLQSVEWR
jgi:hypothetical protein